MESQISGAGLEHQLEDLKALLPNLSVKDREFAESLLDGPYGYAKRGYLTPKQSMYVPRLLEKALKGEAPKTTIPDLGSTVKLKEKFALAAKALKYPRLTVALTTFMVDSPHELVPTSVQFSLCGENSQYTGDWHLKIVETDEYLGRLSVTGEYFPSNVARGKTQEFKKALIDLICHLLDDPETTMASNGKLTGFCCYCHSKLETEESVHYGYGPVCAKHWGLPWSKVFKVKA